jgi:hypothetical protein
MATTTAVNGKPIEQAEKPVPASQKQEPVTVPFNPFIVLSTIDVNNELAAMAGRFNKSWKAQRNERIATIAAEYNCSTVEACFAVWLQDDARAILSREKVKETADAIVNILDEVIGKSSALALGQIESKYSDVSVIDRPDVGRKVREQANRMFTSKIASMILDKVYEHLKIKESDWM